MNGKKKRAGCVLDREAIVTIIQDIPNFFQLIGLNSQDIKHLPAMVGGSVLHVPPTPHPKQEKRRQQQQKGELIPMIYEKFPQIWAHFLPDSLFLNMFLGNLDKFMPKSTPSKLACKCHSFFGGQCHKLLETNSLPSKKDISSFNHLENMMSIILGNCGWF